MNNHLLLSKNLTIETKPLQSDEPTSSTQAGPRAGSSRSNNNGSGGKSRSFSVAGLAYVTANSLWEGGQTKTDVIRPVWLMLAGSEGEVRPFVANLQNGRKAVLTNAQTETSQQYYGRSKPPQLECIKTGRYRYVWQRGGGRAGDIAVVTAYQPDLFALEPGMIDPHEVKFVCLTPLWWHETQMKLLKADRKLCQRLLAHINRAWPGLGSGNGTFSQQDLLELVPRAAYFAAYLERRTRRPVIDTLEFSLQLYVQALSSQVAYLASSSTDRQHTTNSTSPDLWSFARPTDRDYFVERGTASVGLLPGVVCKTPQSEIDAFLAQQVKTYFEAQAQLSKEWRAKPLAVPVINVGDTKHEPKQPDLHKAQHEQRPEILASYKLKQAQKSRRTQAALTGKVPQLAFDLTSYSE